jgi:hypothetical protein
MATFNQDPLGQASVTTTLDDFSLLISGALPVRTREHTALGSSVQYARATVIYLDDLEDVTLTDPQLNDRLVYDGSLWRNKTV